MKMKAAMVARVNFIHAIKPNRERYRLDELNCIEKTAGIIFDAINPVISHLYFVLSKLYSCFIVDKQKNSFDLTNSTEFFIESLELITRDILELSFQKFPIHGMHRRIQEMIDKGIPVLTCVNLKYLYYSQFYRDIDKATFFAIIGYDRRKKIYTIMNGHHKKQDEHIYDYFYIKFSDLKKMARAVTDNFLYTISMSEGQTRAGQGNEHYRTKEYEYHILEKIANMYLQLVLNEDSREFHIIGDINADIRKVATRTVYNTNNIPFSIYDIRVCSINKRIFYTELVWLLEYYSNGTINPKELEALKKLLGTVSPCFETLYPKCSMSFFRKQFIAAEDILDKQLKIEYRMRDKIQRIMAAITYEFENQRTAFQSNLPGRKIDYFENGKFVFENNEDEVITISEKGIVFYYTNEKIYDNFEIDRVPKVILKNEIERSESFTFAVHLKIEDNGASEYLSGIFFRDALNRLYLFGSYMGHSVIFLEFFAPKVHEEIYRGAIDGRDLYLCISSIGHEIRFSCKDTISMEEVLFKTFPHNDLHVRELATGSLAWKPNSGFRFEFSDISYTIHASYQSSTA